MFSDEKSIFAPDHRWGLFFFFLILLSGFGVRMYDLKDPPLDYAAVRQLRSAMIARGKYYSRLQDVPAWKQEVAQKQGEQPRLEPTVMESLVATAYRMAGGEYLWIARIISSLFWTAGGIFLFQLLREIVSLDGALIGLTYYLFNPFGIITSRSFQPDPLMTALIIASWWSFYRWHRSSTWRWTAWVGLITGAALFIKPTAIFFLLGGMAVGVLSKKPLQKTFKDGQVWMIAILSGAPVIAYYVYGLVIEGSPGKNLSTVFYPDLLGTKEYVRGLIDAFASTAGHEIIFLLGMLGLLWFWGKKPLGFLLGIWVGYILLWIVFTYHTVTHTYYHLPAIPLLAVSISAVAEFVFSRISWGRIQYLFRFGLVLLVVIGVGGGYFLLFGEDYRNEPVFYHTVANFVSRDAKKVVLSQDYGNRIAYYGWINPRLWQNPADINYSQPYSQNQEAFAEGFNDITAASDYFIITRKRAFRNNQYLYRHLHENYPVYKEGGGYIIFDLTRKIDS